MTRPRNSKAPRADPRQTAPVCERMFKTVHTKVLSADDPAALREAGRLLAAGELVAVPTETVYGLAADAGNPGAVRKIFEVKGRPQDNPLIVHIADLEMWAPLVEELPKEALTLAEAFWPGPLTIILKKSARVPMETSAGLDSVGVRFPSHPAARAVIRAAGCPLAAPSANLSGSPSPTSAKHCFDDLCGRVPLILDGGDCGVGIESTVVSLVGEPVVLRPGAVTAAALSKTLGRPVPVSAAATKPLEAGATAASPGMKYRHYSPKAKVTLVEGTAEAFARLLDRAEEGTFGLVFEGEDALTKRPCVVYGKSGDPASQARGVFAALRELDGRGAKRVLARCPEERDGAGLGVYNRLLRAAAFEVIRADSFGT